MRNKKVSILTQAAMIAALYVVLTVVFAPFSFGKVQVRAAEMLAVLPIFTSAAVPGLFVGCLLGNILGGALLPDVVFGSLATLLGAYGTWKLRSCGSLLPMLPPVLANSCIVPFVLRAAYAVPIPIPVLMVTVGIGEVISCGVLGGMLRMVLKRNRIVF